MFEASEPVETSGEAWEQLMKEALEKFDQKQEVLCPKNVRRFIHRWIINTVITTCKLGWATMITIANKLVLLILLSPVPATVNNRCCFINAEQHCWNNNEQHCSFNNIVRSSTLFVHQHCSFNNIVRSTTLFVQQHCSFNNIVRSTTSFVQQHCSFNNIVCSTTLFVQQHCSFNNIVRSTLFVQQHCSFNNIVRSTTLFSHDSTNNAVATSVIVSFALTKAPQLSLHNFIIPWRLFLFLFSVVIKYVLSANCENICLYAPEQIEKNTVAVCAKGELFVLWRGSEDTSERSTAK